MFDPVSSETTLIPLIGPSEKTGTSDEFNSIQYLFEMDDQPGLEVLCNIGNRANQKTVFQIVSPRQKKVISHFEGLIGDDIDGDGEWTGAELGFVVFQSASGKWKLFSRASAGHSDYKPRSINIWDIESKQLELQFHTATPSPIPAFFRDTEGVMHFFIVPHTPDNWIKVNGERILDENGNYINVSETVNGILIKDNEAYDKYFTYDDSKPGQPALNMQWMNKRGNLMSGKSMITKSREGNDLAVSCDSYIRAWDLTSTGSIHVYDLFSGEIIAEYAADPETSILDMVAIDGEEQIYAIQQESPVLYHYDIREGLKNSVVLSEDPNARVLLGGATDMNGDGDADIVIKLIEFGAQSVQIYNSDLTLLDEIDTPYSNKCAIADNDRDGFPEVYLLDEVTRSEIHVIEYQPPASQANFYNLY